ncbi:hypothetical protein JCM11491_000572 [Sporobolomyces phaffii]
MSQNRPYGRPPPPPPPPGQRFQPNAHYSSAAAPVAHYAPPTRTPDYYWDWERERDRARHAAAYYPAAPTHAPALAPAPYPPHERAVYPPQQPLSYNRDPTSRRAAGDRRAPLAYPPPPPPPPPSRPVPPPSRRRPPPPPPPPPPAAPVSLKHSFPALQDPDPIAQVGISSRSASSLSPRVEPRAAPSTHITWPRSPSLPPPPPPRLPPPDPSPVPVSVPAPAVPPPPQAPLSTAARPPPVPPLPARLARTNPAAARDDNDDRTSPAAARVVEVEAIRAGPATATAVDNDNDNDNDDLEASPLLYPPSPASPPPERTRPRDPTPPAAVTRPDEDDADESHGAEPVVDTPDEVVDAQDLMAEIEREIEREAIERLEKGVNDDDDDDGDYGFEGLEELLGMGIIGIGATSGGGGGGGLKGGHETPDLYPPSPAAAAGGGDTFGETKKDEEQQDERGGERLAREPRVAEDLPRSDPPAIEPSTREPGRDPVDAAAAEREDDAGSGADELEEETSGDDEAFVASALVNRRPPRPPNDHAASTLGAARRAEDEGDDEEGEEVELDMTADDTHTFEDAIQPFPDPDDDDDDDGDDSGIEETSSTVLHHHGSEFDFEMGSGDEVQHEPEDSALEPGFDSSDDENGKANDGDNDGEGQRRPRKRRRIESAASRARSIEPATGKMDVEQASTGRADGGGVGTDSIARASRLSLGKGNAAGALAIGEHRAAKGDSSTTADDGDTDQPTQADSSAGPVAPSGASESRAGNEIELELEEGELPADAANASGTTQSTTKGPTQPQVAPFARAPTSVLPNGKAVYQRRVPLTAPIVSPITAPGIPNTSAPATPSATPSPAASKGVYTRRALLAGTDPLTISSLSNLNAANAAATPPSSATKATYERPPGLAAPAVPSKAKGALPLSPEEKVERLPAKLHALFPSDFASPAAVPYAAVFGAPNHSANPSRALAHQPDEKALWGFWPSPPALKAGKAVFPARRPVAVVDDPSVDPRGPGAARTEVFIDNSNVFYSFLNWVRARKDAKVIQKLYKQADAAAGKPRSVKILTLAGKKVKMDYDVLFGLLERGRKVERRVLVASSPMWQSLEAAVNWGYEVSLLQRVPRILPADPTSHNQGSSAPAVAGANPAVNKKRDKKGNLISKDVKHYKEQAVDELVHLKILESVLDYTPPPLPPPDASAVEPKEEVADEASDTQPSSGDAAMDDAKDVKVEREDGSGSEVEASDNTAGNEAVATTGGPGLRDSAVPSAVPDGAGPRSRPTLVIATGDANSSEYNPGGFLGCVRRALDRGWDVEIASFSTHGLSSLWAGERAKRVTDDGRARGELRIVNLETFAEELVN